MQEMLRFKPFDNLLSLRRTLYRVFAKRLARPAWWYLTGIAAPGVPVDLYERADGYEIRALVPGLKPEELELTTGEHSLTLRGRLPQWLSDEETRQVTCHVREIGSGAFVRRIPLPKPFQADQIRASLEDGVACIWVPLTLEALGRRIPFQAGKVPSRLASQAVEAEQGTRSR